MKRHILLPTDFSDNSWSAIVYALKLYKDVECEFCLLNSVAMRASTMSNLSNSLLRIMKTKAIKELKDLKALVESTNSNSNHNFTTLLSTRDLLEAIQSVVEKGKTDMIIMGTKGATGAKELLFGSHTVKVIKKNKSCPLLIVPDEYNFKVPEQIAFPTDYKRPFDDKIVQSVKVLSELYNSKIRVVHINKEETLDRLQQVNYAKLKESLIDYQHSFHWIPDYGTKETEIKDFITDLEIDILIMVNYKHSLLEKIIKEPVIKKIGFNPEVPFLVIPE